MNGIEENALQACLNRLLRHTVGVVNSIRTVGTDRFTGRRGDTEEPGTGCAVRWGDHHCILTACHVIDNAQPDDLRIYVYPNEKIIFKSPVDLRGEDIRDGVPLNVGDEKIHLCAWEDLAVVTVPPTSFPGLDFVDVLNESVEPAAGEPVNCCGFPSDHRVTVERTLVENKEVVHIALYPTVFNGEVLPTPSDEEIKFKFTAFVPSFHYLIPYSVPEVSQHPRGVSGAAMWCEGKERLIVWRPNFKFAGVASCCYKNGTIVQVIKPSVAHRFLEEVFGPGEPQIRG